MSSSTFRTCPDGHRCENGSSCAQHPLEEGTYYCDCETSPGDFAGLYCEYEAETYCQLQQETTSDWFCSNQGTCVLSTTGGGGSGGEAAQWTCDCPTDFDGPHCQFVQGNVPREWPGFDFDPATATLSNPSSKQQNGESGLHVGVTITIVIVVLAFVLLTSLLVIRKIRGSSNFNSKNPDSAQNATRDPSEGLKLEADGSVLQEVMQSFSRTPNSTIEGDFDAMIANRSSDDHSVEVGMNGNGGRYSDNPDELL